MCVEFFKIKKKVPKADFVCTEKLGGFFEIILWGFYVEFSSAFETNQLFEWGNFNTLF